MIQNLKTSKIQPMKINNLPLLNNIFVFFGSNKICFWVVYVVKIY